jgi:hypothetical protein
MKEFEEEIIKHRSRKNTRKWCKGRKGFEHIGKWRMVQKHLFKMYEFRCIHCEKKLDYWWDSKFLGMPMPEGLKEFLENEGGKDDG